MYLTQEQINVLKQTLQNKRLKIELLDSNMRTIDSIEGYAIGGSITANANNDIRRTGNIQMSIPISQQATSLLDQLGGFTIEIGGKIWLDKYVKIKVGIENILSQDGDIVWYSLGVFLINKPSRTFSATDFSISFECIDLMSKLTGQRQGQLTGTTTIIEKGYYETINGEQVYTRTKLADALISTITELGGFSKYSIYPIPEVYQYLPYDIKVGVGSTVYDILKQLMDIISTWQMYFDLDGTFVVEPIPSGENAIVYDIDDQQYISNTASSDFENVKNQIIIYGRTNTLSYYTENTEEVNSNVVYNGDTLILNYESLNQQIFTISGVTFGFMSLSKPNSQPFTKVQLQVGGETILTSDLVKFENVKTSFGETYDTTQVEANTILPNDIYFIRIYSGTLTADEYVDITQPVTFEFMGKQAVSYNLVNDNKESPFYVNNNIDAINYYCGEAKTPENANWGEGFEITLNNDSTITGLNSGDIITFIANAPNVYSQGQNFSYINVKQANGSVVAANLPLVQNTWNTNVSPAIRPYVLENKISNDYTIWKLRYEIINNVPSLVLVGRNENVIVKVCTGGEYDNIYADQLAYERALYELYQYSNLNDDLSLSIVPNYLLDVNCKIGFNEDSSLPLGILKIQPYKVRNQENSFLYQQFVTLLGKDFYVKKEEKIDYFLTKQIIYPLGIESTPQTISAIKIYESGNLVGK